MRSIITRKLISSGIQRHAGKKVMLEFRYAYYFLRRAVEGQFVGFFRKTAQSTYIVWDTLLT